MLGAGLLRYVLARAVSAAAAQMLTVAVGWIIYERTGSAFNLGLVGLCAFLPSLVLMLPAGVAADRFRRGAVIQLALLVQGAGAILLYAVSSAPHFHLPLVYLIVVAVGAGRAFSNPAFQSLLPDIVSRADLPKAVATSTSANQAATMVGPAAGGLLMAWMGPAVFPALTVIYLASAALLIGLRGAQHFPKAGGRPSPWAGLAYIRTNRLILGAITLDLFTVLLGGVTAILPVFARDILHAGPVGLGLLNSAPAVGALLVGLLLAYVPLRRHTGPILLSSVCAYGICTVLFALSHQLWLSLAMMAALGGFDMVSMVIRQTLVQIATPDPMRGRVSAVNALFVGASNQVGGFESGAVASLIGAPLSAVVGGVGAVAVVILTAMVFPEIRKADDLHALAAEPEDASLAEPA